MRKLLQPSIILCFVLGVLLVATVAALLQSREHLQTLETELTLERDTVRTKLLTYMVTVDRTGRDASLESFVVPCKQAKQRRFNQLLGTLHTLGVNEAQELYNLFPVCGEFLARQKHALVYQLGTQIETYVNINDILDKRYQEPAPSDSAKWQTLYELETVRANAFADLVATQKKLIENRIPQAEQTSSDEELLADAERIQSELDTLGADIESTHEQLHAYVPTP